MHETGTPRCEVTQGTINDIQYLIPPLQGLNDICKLPDTVLLLHLAVTVSFMGRGQGHQHHQPFVVH